MLLSSAGFSAKGLRRWTSWTVGLALFAYGIETVQALRGLDPRFSKVGGNLDAIFGLAFFVTALALITLGVVLGIRFFRASALVSGPVLLAVRYGFLAVAAGYASGVWMSAISGRTRLPAGNILPLHALGFHGLQAVPAVALLLVWAGAGEAEAKRWVHAAGLAWLALCGAVAWQTALGRPLGEFSTPTVVALAAAAGVGRGVPVRRCGLDPGRLSGAGRDRPGCRGAPEGQLTEPR